MKLYFIRHGQTDWNVKGKIQGSCDIELNSAGIEQAEELSRKILDEKLLFLKIYSSPQKRAIQTAEILSNATKVDYTIVEGLEEINLGDWEGLSWAEVKERYPTEYKEWYLNRRDTKPPRGETYQELLQRVLASLHRITLENLDPVLIVTHNAVIKSLQCFLTNSPFHEMKNFNTENCSMIEIDSDILLKGDVV